MTEFTQYEKQVVVSILIAIMEADGIIDPHETAFLDEVLDDFGFTEQDMDSIAEFDFTMTAGEFAKFTDVKKERARELFIAMAKCDGYADPRELKIISDLGR